MLNKKSKDELRKIIKKDYGRDITDEQAEELGASLLRLTKVGLSALAREYDRKQRASEE